MQANGGLHDFFILQNIKEEGDYSRIYQISEHGADDGNDEEGLDGIAVFIAYCTHVGHRIGSSTKTETADACTQDGSIVSQALLDRLAKGCD